ncbi:phosphate ABC transporter permease subunit PstC [Pelotomaculum sp. PtaB.Bin117]|uniref:phosphate ABC transporter permease subunit PstC n=1 Tax=Pelotomaculum sp. PtaB.Bin117 TaxID=1811694 RepID=UPI0009CA60AA|nr:phosphate ABC transporter permease subunit PstC [Pelotomaculum sp. PtaB.Bin117]OPX85934.1 MAG: Phosphate transport system permease protein PstC [Pelotomaculum sp. PtaB.Bin117]
MLKSINPAGSELLGKTLATGAALIAIVSTITIVIFISIKGLSTFTAYGVSIKEFLFSANWLPDRPPGEGGPQVGVLAFIFGSVIVSMLAVLLSAPLSVTCAVFIVEIAPFWGQRFLQPAIELLAGIPSVVYGYIGLSVLVPFIRGNIGGLGFSVLAGFLVLSVMILPTIVSILTDSLKSLPREYKEAALALGSTRWQAIRLVLIPAARSGLVTGVVLGLARAFGEALAVQMVIGNTRKIPTSILDPVITLTSAITMDMGNTPMGSLWNSTLWSMGLFLLLMSFFFILVVRYGVRKGGISR